MRSLILYVVLAVSAFAQQASITSITGNVTDSHGATIPNAMVKAVADSTQTTYSGTTNAAGVYVFPSVRIDTYTVTASAPGFDAVTRKGVLVEVNQVVRADFQ